jgi:mono/diheme cytochrome c family protein
VSGVKNCGRIGRKAGISAAAILTALGTLGLLSLAGLTKANDADSQGGGAKKGAELFDQNCSTCHETNPHFSAEKLDAIKKHMGEQVADLSPEEQNAIIAFLESK